MRSVLAAVVLVTTLSSGNLASGQTPSNIIRDVRAAVAAKDFARGEQLVQEYISGGGLTPEVIEAISWLARGAFAAGQLDEAARYSADTQDIAVGALGTYSLDTDTHLQIALGAGIETDALVRVARGDRSSAIYFLQREIERYRGSPIEKRLQKNLNLLSLEGEPAPALEAREYLGGPVPSLDQLKGKVVLLFFWAHWCPDCKAQGPILQKLLEKYRAQGLTIVAPTQRFGYIVAGQGVPADQEQQHITEVRDQYYAFLRNEAVPVSDANHKRYGVSSTPTLALVDRQGIVRLYRPGRMTEEELDAAIRKLL